MALPARLAPAVAAALTLALAAPAAANFNNLPGEPFDAASNTPYASVAAVTKVSPVFNNASFDEDPGEIAAPFQFLGCNRWGSKTAWVRFATRVSGRANVTVDSTTGGHDVMFKAHTAPTVSSDYSLLSQQVNTNPNSTPCNSERVGVPNEFDQFSFYVPPGTSRILYVQVLSICDNSNMTPPCDDAEQAAAPGGSTNVTLTYTPDDRDGDRIADSLDACPAQRNPCAVDADGDGFFKNALPGAKEDCNDADKGVNPGSSERRGNRKDDDCDGSAEPYPRVRNGVTAAFGGHRGQSRASFFTKLFVRNVPKGLRAVVECKGRGCPGPREYVAKKFRKRLNIRARMGRRANLRPGAKVTVKLLRKGHVGRVLVYRFRKRGAPTHAVGCTLPGSGSSGSCRVARRRAPTPRRSGEPRAPWSRGGARTALVLAAFLGGRAARSDDDSAAGSAPAAMWRTRARARASAPPPACPGCEGTNRPEGQVAEARRRKRPRQDTATGATSNDSARRSRPAAEHTTQPTQPDRRPTTPRASAAGLTRT